MRFIWTKITTDEVVVEYMIRNSPEDETTTFIYFTQRKYYYFKTRLPSLTTFYRTDQKLLTTRPKLRVDMSDPLASDTNPSDRSIYHKCFPCFPKESIETLDVHE